MVYVVIRQRGPKILYIFYTLRLMLVMHTLTYVTCKIQHKLDDHCAIVIISQER